MSDPEEVNRVAEKVTGVLESRGVGALVIGAVALAAHGYVRADIVELLSRNPDVDVAAIRDLCQGWRLRGLDPLIDEAMGKG